MTSLLSMILLVAVFGSSVAAQQAPLSLYWIDVEGSGWTLLVAPTGESVLVDARENLDRDVSRVSKVATDSLG